MTGGGAYAGGVLPLGRDAGNRYGPWIIAAALYVAALALAGTMAIGSWPFRAPARESSTG